MTKAKIIDKGLETVVLQERHYLAKFNSPFILNLLCTFQNTNNLFFVTELITGGDLQYHIDHYDYYFTETQLKFLITNLILGLEYMHKKEVIHCNLRPDNIMFDTRGFARIIGFGDCCLNGEKIEPKILEYDASEYMAPEIFEKAELDYTVDFYSLGVVSYKLMSGKDFTLGNEDIDLTQDKKLREKYSDICLEFVSFLLKQDPRERIGAREREKEIKFHDFLLGMKWDLIKQKCFISPILDIIKFSRIQSEYPEIFDYKACNKSKDETTPGEIQNYIEIIEGPAYPMYFQYFSCIRVENILRELNNNDDEYREYYNILGKERRMKRSRSSEEISSKFRDEMERYHHHHHHRPHKRYENIYELPYVSKKTQIYRKREKQLKNYYKDKLFRYRDYVKKLKDKNYEVQVLQAKYVDKNHPMFKQFFPPPHTQRKMLPSKSTKKYGLSNEQNDSFLPRIMPPLKPLDEIYSNKMIMNNNMRMNKMMSQFYNKMNDDRNNFFVKYNSKNHLDKPDYSEEDFSSSDSFDEFDGQNKNNYKMKEIPNYNNQYPNVHYYKLIDRVKNKNLIPGTIKEEYSFEKTEESEKSESTSVRYIKKGMKQKGNPPLMNRGNNIYYNNIIEEVKSNSNDEESEDSDDSDDSEESEDDD